MSHIVNRLARDSDLACHGRSRLTLAYPTKQQNGLCWPKVLSLKHGPTVQVVDASTRTPVYRQPAFLGYAEHTCRLHAPAAMWAFQLVLVKVLQQPNRAQLVIE